MENLTTDEEEFRDNGMFIILARTDLKEFPLTIHMDQGDYICHEPFMYPNRCNEIPTAPYDRRRVPWVNIGITKHDEGYAVFSEEWENALYEEVLALKKDYYYKVYKDVIADKV